MGWIKKVPAPHECRTPSGDVFWIGVGSIWECRRCGTRWEAVDTVYGPHFQAVKSSDNRRLKEGK